MPLFFRQDTSGMVKDLSGLEGFWCGTNKTSCWLIGGGPSLSQAPHELINNSPAPRFCLNHAGRAPDGEAPFIKPDFWLGFDTLAKFQPSIFRSPDIIKFVHAPRAMNLVSGTDEKVCDCPGVILIGNEYRPFGQFLNASSRRFNNSLDTLIESIDVAYRMGFRQLYLVGTELRIEPSAEQLEAARSVGVKYENGKVEYHPKAKTSNDESKPPPPVWTDLFEHFVEECERCKLGRTMDEVKAKLASLQREQQYSFSETKSMQAAIQSDTHYFEAVQRLRLSRKSMTEHGLEIVSCTPNSRLNAYFPYMDVESAASRILHQVGDPVSEKNDGRYRGEHPQPNEGFPYMRDIDPVGLNDIRRAENNKAQPDIEVNMANDRRAEVLRKFEELDNCKPVEIG